MKRKRIYKTISLCLCALLCLSMLCGCESWNNFRKAFIDPPEPEVFTVKIGILEPQTGRKSYDAEDEVAGMELAHELFPKRENMTSSSSTRTTAPIPTYARKPPRGS